jgi:uncharacterized membrane protein YeaQ/YmgE (transglycosylase-associated protein family)
MLLVILVVLVVLFVVLPLVGMALWALTTTILVGLVIGGLGRLVVPGPQRIGFLATIAAGLCGSIVGGFLGQHVLGVGWILTIIIEIALSAGVVAVLAGRGRHLPAG